MADRVPDNRSREEVAKESYAFWRLVGADHLHACCLLANEDRETSFRIGVVGDHGEAYGPAQWHNARLEDIKKGTGIDVKLAPHTQQLAGWYWEMTKGPYKHIWPKLEKAQTKEEINQVLIHDFERSSNQERDLRRQNALTVYWMMYLESQDGH